MLHRVRDLHPLAGFLMRLTRLLLRSGALAAVTFATACASGGASSTAAGTGTVSQSLPGTQAGSMVVTTSNTADVVAVPFSPDAVFRILPSVYDSVAVSVNTIDPAKRVIGNNGFKVRTRLGKKYLSQLMDCGNSQIGPNADTYDVFLSVLTTVMADGTTGARIATVLDAQARPATYNQPYSRCTTKGALELRISELVTARLKAAK
jgi:hypothetical protein